MLVWAVWRNERLWLTVVLLLLCSRHDVESFSSSSTSRRPERLAAKNNRDLLHRYQDEVAGPMASSFQPREFNPRLSNCHFQTIAANFWRPEINYYTDSLVPALLLGSLFSKQQQEEQETVFWDERERIDTPDGDWFHVDYKYTSHEVSNGMVLLLHGLESNSNSKLSRDMAQAFLDVGLDVACLNFRGCCGQAPNDLLGGYHLGFTRDVQHFMDVLAQRNGDSMPPIYLSGFSLGADVILKLLGELGVDAPLKYNVRGAAAFCVPLDAARNAPFLGQPGFNQVVYCENLLRTLRKRAQFQLDQYCDGNVNTDKFDYAGVMKAKTITDFDEAFVAPIYGFDSAMDYYRKTSCIYFLEDIAVPCLILNARDDPFMDPSHWPVELTQAHGGRAPIQMVRTQHGGHLGFVLHQVQDGESVPNTSWSSTELARFLEHVHNQHETTKTTKE